MLRLLCAVLVIALQWREVTPTARHDQRLRESDIGARAPESFVARLRVTNRRDRTPHEIEVWRAGPARVLVRFLDAAERGRYLLRRDADLWLLTPDARRAVKLNPAYRVYSGVNLDEILGVQLQRDYRLAAVEEGVGQNGEALTAFELRAAGAATFPSIRHVVRDGDARPVSTSYRLGSGKTASVIEYLEWATTPVLHARRFVVRDELRKSSVADVDIESVQARPVPDDLFDVSDSSGRRRLEGRPEGPPARSPSGPG